MKLAYLFRLCRTITTKSRAPNVFVADLFNTKATSPDENEIDDTSSKEKPIPFLIRNTTADGNPISIGALRPINTPKIQSFNSFIKRLPPPQKYVFEPRQVLKGDVVDPYNYLRALFRGEVILTSDKLPTFASPRVWGMTTASTLGARGSYTTRSPQGFSPIRKKPPTTTTTSAPFFARLGLSSKGEKNNLEKKIPLPVGMLGTPTPSYKNLKTLLLSRGQAVQGSKLLTPRNKLLTPRSNLLSQPTRQPTKGFSQTVRPTKGQTLLTSSKEGGDGLKKDSIEEMLKKLLQKNNPSFAAVPAVPQRSAPKEFPVLEAVPTRGTPTRAPTRMPTRTPTRMPLTPFPTKRLLVPTKSTTKPPVQTQTFFSPMPAKPKFSAVPAVPGATPRLSVQLTRTPKQLPEFSMSVGSGTKFTSVRPPTQFPTFRHFPAGNSQLVRALATLRTTASPRLNKQALSFVDQQQKASILGELQQSLSKKPTMSPHLASLFTSSSRRPPTTPVSVVQSNFNEVTRRPHTISSSFSQPQSSSSIEQLRSSLLAAVTKTRQNKNLALSKATTSAPRSGHLSLGSALRGTPTTKRPPTLPRGTTRGEIMALLSRQQKTTPMPPSTTTTTRPHFVHTTIQPQVQSTTNRAEVLRLLQQLLGSVQSSSTTTPTTTSTTTTPTTTTSISTTSVTKFGAFKRAPSLRFDSPPQLKVELALQDLPRELPYGMTTSTPVHPNAPFPNMEAPQHDLLTSHLLLPKARVTTASPVHPASPFPNLQAPDFIPPSPDRFQTDFSDKLVALPRHDLLPPDPARPGPTPPPGPLKLRLNTDFLESQLPRNGRHHKEHRDPRWNTPRPTLEAPPPMHPVPRTRLVAPRSQQPAMNRRLSIDGPTESSLTPLEKLAYNTVPRYITLNF